MSNDLAIIAKQFNVTPDYLNTLRNMYAKDATPDEFMVFVTLGRKYDLDPMLNEISFVKHKPGAKPIMQTTRDGYLKIANRDKNFNGMTGEIIYEGDILTRLEDGSIAITYGQNHMLFDRTKITGAYCNVYRKDRSKSSTVVVSFKDYDKSNMGFNPWKTHPHAMILKVAEAMALKRAFAINGLLTQEEHDPTITEREPDFTYLSENRELYFKFIDELKKNGEVEPLIEKIKKDYNIDRLGKLPINKIEEILLTYSPIVVEEIKEEE